MPSPRIAFTVYPSAFQSPGGGEIQLLKTKEYLEKLGISVTLFDPWRHKLSNFDILHTFGSVKDSLGLMESAQAQGVTNILSTICWYSWKSAWGTDGSLKARALAVSRHAAKVFFPFVPSQRKRMMQIADLLLPNSQSEADQLHRFFGVPKQKIGVVPNGVDPSFASAAPEPFISQYKLKDFVLCVGRIEPRKNQLNMVRALAGTHIPAVFIGDAVPQYQDYFDRCRKEATSNIHFLGAIPHHSGLIASACAAANTFLLASWLETPGLAALEAGLAGAKVVITQEGATREYFKDLAEYVPPDKPLVIREAVLKVFKAPKDNQLSQAIVRDYSWAEVAKQTLEKYFLALNRK